MISYRVEQWKLHNDETIEGGWLVWQLMYTYYQQIINDSKGLGGGWFNESEKMVDVWWKMVIEDHLSSQFITNMKNNF